MFIGVGRYELFIPDATSLKDKRQVLRSVTQSIQHKLHLSVSEVEYQDKWQRAALGVSCVSQSPERCRQVLQDVEKIMSRAVIGGAEISDRRVNVVAWSDIE